MLKKWKKNYLHSLSINFSLDRYETINKKELTYLLKVQTTWKTVSSYCLKYREITDSKNPKVARIKQRKHNGFIKLCSLWQ